MFSSQFQNITENQLAGLEIRILIMPVKHTVTTKIYCFTSKFTRIYTGQALFYAGQ